MKEKKTHTLNTKTFAILSTISNSMHTECMKVITLSNTNSAKFQHYYKLFFVLFKYCNAIHIYVDHFALKF